MIRKEKWKSKKIDTQAEKEIITGMIVNDRFLQEIQTIYKSELLKLSYARLVGKWCIEYYQQYGKAPRNTIQELYASYVSSNQIDEAELELVEKFLSNLSQEYEKDGFNFEYALDKAEKYFKTKKIEELRDSLSGAITQNKILEAENMIANFQRIKRPESVGIDILENREAIMNMFEQDDVLLVMPGALGQLWGPFCRDDLIAVAGFYKRGKSFWLEEIGIRSLEKRLKVLFISLEMPQKQMMRRIYQNFLGQTRYKKDDIELPFFTEDNTVDFKIISKKGISSSRCLKKARALKIMFGSGQFKLICFPTNSLTVEELKIHIDNMEYYENFIPDVVIIDYADILAPSYGQKETRHQIDHIWKSLRGLASDKHFLVVTASQMNKAVINRDADQGDLAEDSRKLAHVTSMLALNQNKEDKKKGIMRVGMLGQRHEEFYVGDEVVVLQCLSIGKPCIDSKWRRDLDL